MSQHFFTPDNFDFLSSGQYRTFQHEGHIYLLISDTRIISPRGPIPKVKVSRVSFNVDGTVTLTYIDEWYGFADATNGAIFDAQKLREQNPATGDVPDPQNN